MNDSRSTPIERLNLSVRAYNCLKRDGLHTVDQVLAMRADELLAMRHFGRKCLDELREKLTEYGFLSPAAARRWAGIPDDELDGEDVTEMEEEEAGPPPRGELAMIAGHAEDAPALPVREQVMSAAVEEVADYGYQAMLPGHLLIALLRQPVVTGWLRQAGLEIDVVAVRRAFHQVTRPASATGQAAQGFLDADLRALVDQIDATDRSDPDGRRASLLGLRLLLQQDPPCRSWVMAGGVSPPALEAALTSLLADG